MGTDLKQPPTPNLDAAIIVRQTSERVGEFVMEWLAQQGIVLAQRMWQQYACPKRWARLGRNGQLVELSWLSSLRPGDVELDPWDCPCGVEMTVLLDRPPNPYPHATWKLIQIHRSDAWIRDQLARFFGLDPDEMHREQQALLDWLRATHDLEHPDV